MAERKGTISIQTNDIFPIIKKWLYSEHDIFLRELVSNASDAITKRAAIGRNLNQEIPAAKITVAVDSKERTITISDNGLGMTEDEIEKYIAQLAFSGAEEFVEKMKESGDVSREDIIGKFGLGFYSAFMVAEEVEVDSLSMQEGAKPAKWSCKGDTDYSFTESQKTEVGTDIILHINEESKEFLDFYKTSEVLTRYCKFMPAPIELIDLVKQEEQKDKKPEEQNFSKQINETEPLWKKDPSSLKDEDYKAFYRTLFPFDQEPLFWLHLNVDHPFNLQGILYFPKLQPNKPLNENNIHLYCRQVFVSDNLKHIVPEFLGLLKGAIDSIDIPLNISRSALQGDPNVKKISNYIIKKVAESLKKLFKQDRKRFENVWEDIGLFVKYGVISDEKFDELVREYVLFKTAPDELLTMQEYVEKIPDQHKEKLKDKIVYYVKDEYDPALRRQLFEEGVRSVETDNYIDPHFTQHVEMKPVKEKTYKFTTIATELENILEQEKVTDADIKVKDLFTEILVGKEPEKKEDEEQTPSEPKSLEVEVKNYKNTDTAAYFKIDESMKRFQQMTQNMGQGNFSMPIKKTLVINPANALIKNALQIWESGENKDLVGKICHHVQDLAQISSEGLTTEQKDDFVTRSQNLIRELSQFAISK